MNWNPFKKNRQDLTIQAAQQQMQQMQQMQQPIQTQTHQQVQPQVQTTNTPPVQTQQEQEPQTTKETIQLIDFNTLEELNQWLENAEYTEIINIEQKFILLNKEIDYEKVEKKTMKPQPERERMNYGVTYLVQYVK